MQEKATKKEDSFGLTRGFLYVRILKVKIAACFRIIELEAEGFFVQNQ
jgi:hypothetical protein